MSLLHTKTNVLKFYTNRKIPPRDDRSNTGGMYFSVFTDTNFWGIISITLKKPPQDDRRVIAARLYFVRF